MKALLLVLVLASAPSPAPSPSPSHREAVTPLPVTPLPGPKPAGEGWHLNSEGSLWMRNDEWETIERRDRQIQRMDALLSRLEDFMKRRRR